MDVKVDAPSQAVVAGAKRAKDLVGPKGLEELFPTKIKLDPNGRKHQWEWVALLPFMDERQLELVLDCVSDTFDASERDRNRQTRALAGAGAGCPEPPFDIAWLGLNKSDEPPYYCFEEPKDLQRHVCKPLARRNTQTPLTGALGRETEPVWTPGRPAGKMGDSGELRRRPRMTLDELESAGRMIRHQMGVDARLQQLQQQGGWQASQGMRADAPAYRTGPPGAPGGGYPYNGGGGGGMRATAPAYGAPGGYGAPYNGGGGMRANAPAYGAGDGYNQVYGGGMRANAPAYGGGYAGGGGYSSGMRANAPRTNSSRNTAPGGLQANHPLLMRRPPPRRARRLGPIHSAPPAGGGYAHSAPPRQRRRRAALRDSARRHGRRRREPAHDPRRRRTWSSFNSFGVVHVILATAALRRRPRGSCAVQSYRMRPTRAGRRRLAPPPRPQFWKR